MSAYKVTSVERDGGFSNEHGEFAAWKLMVTENGGEPVEVARNTKVGVSADPQVGDVIDGELIPGKYRPKLVKQKGASGGFNGGGKSPEQQKSIVRQHSQHMGILFMAAVQKEGIELPGDDVAEKLDSLRKVVDWFVKDAEA